MILNKILNLLLSLILIFTFLISCDEQPIDPIEDESGIYSFYGTLEVGNSPNFVRVRNLNEPFLSPSDSFDGTVTFEDLETGEITTLQDSVVEYNGNFTHNFIIENEIEHNKEYRLKAERSDGEEVQSIARTPGITNIEFIPDEDILCETQMEFRFRNVINPESVQITISVNYNNQTETAPLNIFIEELDYSRVNDDEMTLRMSPRNLLTEVFPPILPDNPTFNPFNLFPTVSCNMLQEKNISITYTHFGSEWAQGRPTRGPIDIESGDVENGLGFFGSFRRDTFSFSYSTEEEL